MDTERDSAEWAKTPMGAMEHYYSLTFLEQTALAYAVEQQKVMVQGAFQARLAEIRAQYEATEVN